MCGRFGAEREYVELARRYQAVIKAIDPGPRYNVAPTDPVPVIVAYDGERYLAHHRWGLVPYWAKDLAVGNRMINARAETVATLPAFRESFVGRRCIIPASRFYEWKTADGSRQPYTILRNDGFPMSFAGVWAVWRNPASNERVLSCSIVTTTANGMMAELHDRMPVILGDEELGLWLDPAVKDVDRLQALLRPCAEDELCAYPVSRLVNRPGNDGPELIAPLPLETAD
jgi:putative SOS response-associated peptidase YedK